MVISDIFKSFSSSFSRYGNLITENLRRFFDYIIKGQKLSKVRLVDIDLRDAIKEENIDKILQIFEKNPNIFQLSFHSHNIFKLLGLFLRPELQEKYPFPKIAEVLKKLFETPILSDPNNNILHKYFDSSYLQNAINLYHTSPEEKISNKYADYVGSSFSKTKYFSEEGFFETLILFMSEPSKHEKVLKILFSLQNLNFFTFLYCVAGVFKSKLEKAFEENLYGEELERYRLNLLALIEITNINYSFDASAIRYLATKDKEFSIKLIKSMRDLVDNSFHSYAEDIRAHAKENFVEGNEDSYVAKHNVRDTILKQDGEHLQDYIYKIFEEIEYMKKLEDSPNHQGLDSYLKKRQIETYQDCCSILFDEICKIRDKPKALQQQIKNFFFSLIIQNNFSLAKTLLQQYKHDDNLEFFRELLDKYTSTFCSPYTGSSTERLTKVQIYSFFNILLDARRTKETDDLILNGFHKDILTYSHDNLAKFMSRFINEDDGKYSENLKVLFNDQKLSSFIHIASLDFKEDDPQLISHLDLLNDLINSYDVTNNSDSKKTYNAGLEPYYVIFFSKLNKHFFDSNGKIYPYVLTSLKIFKDALDAPPPSRLYNLLEYENFGNILSSLQKLVISAQGSSDTDLEFVKKTALEILKALIDHDSFENARYLLQIFEMPDRKEFLKKWFDSYAKLDEVQKAKISEKTALFYLNSYLKLLPDSASFEEFLRLCPDLITSEKLIFSQVSDSRQYVESLFRVCRENPEQKAVSEFIDQLSSKIGYYYQHSGKKEEKTYLAVHLVNRYALDKLEGKPVDEKTLGLAEKLLGFKLNNTLDENEFKKFKDFIIYFEFLSKNPPAHFRRQIRGIHSLFSLIFENNLKQLKESRNFASFERAYNVFASAKNIREILYRYHYTSKGDYKGLDILQKFELKLILEVFEDKEFLKASKNFFTHAAKFLNYQMPDPAGSEEEEKVPYQKLCNLILYCLQNEGFNHILQSIMISFFDTRSVFSGEFYLSDQSYQLFEDVNWKRTFDYGLLKGLASYFREHYHENQQVSPEITEKFYSFLADSINIGHTKKVFFADRAKNWKKLQEDQINFLEATAEYIESDLQDFLNATISTEETVGCIEDYKTLFGNFARRYEREADEGLKKFASEVTKTFKDSRDDPKTVASLVELCALHDNPNFLAVTLSKVNFKQITYLDQYFHHFLELSIGGMLNSEKNSQEIIKTWLDTLSNQISPETKYKLFLMTAKEINKQSKAVIPTVYIKEDLENIVEKLKNGIKEFVDNKTGSTTISKGTIQEINDFQTIKPQPIFSGNKLDTENKAIN